MTSSITGFTVFRLQSSSAFGTPRTEMLKARSFFLRGPQRLHFFWLETCPKPEKSHPRGCCCPVTSIDVGGRGRIRGNTERMATAVLVSAVRSQGPRGRVFVLGVIGRVSLPFMGTPPPIEVGSLGMADSLILMVLALVVFGPRRLPQIGRQIGKLMYEFRKASNDFKFQMEEELRLSEEADRRKKEEAERARIAALPPPTQTIEAGTNVAITEQVSVS